MNRDPITQGDLERARARLEPARFNLLLALPVWALVWLVRAATWLARRLPRRR